MNISDFPPFIRWADFRGLLGVREGFRVEDFCHLLLYLRDPIHAFDEYGNIEAVPGRKGRVPLWPEEQFDAVWDEEVKVAAKWLQKGAFQFDTLAVIRALAAKGEPMNEKARAYLEGKLGEAQAAKEEAERKALEAEQAAARDALFELVRAAGKSVAAGRRDGEEGKGRGHDGEAYRVLNEKYHVLYKTIAMAFLEGAGIPNPTDAELEKEESTLRAEASKARKKQNRHTAKGEEA